MCPDPLDDPLGLRRPPMPLGPRDRALGLLGDLGLTPRAALAGAGLGLLALLGWWWLRSPAPPAAEASLPMTSAATSTAPTGAPTSGMTGGVVLVHAAGAVRQPGLYSLGEGDRVADLLQAAGGPTRGADLDRINLAAPVVDGTQVVVPRRGEPAAPAAPVPGQGDPATPSALVDLNLAGPEELETLPGVGPATAAAIIEFREANGPFATVDDLIDVPGIGEAKLAALADLVSV